MILPRLNEFFGSWIMKIRGIYTPAITPLRQDGEIDWDGFAAILEHLVSAGVDGIVVGGTTGEYYAHSKDCLLYTSPSPRDA